MGTGYWAPAQQLNYKKVPGARVIKISKVIFIRAAGIWKHQIDRVNDWVRANEVQTGFLGAALPTTTTEGARLDLVTDIWLGDWGQNLVASYYKT